MRSSLLHSTGPALLVLLAAGCATVAPTPERPRPVWPEPPAAPRVAFVQSLEDPRDLGIAPTFWQKSVNWITGGQRGMEPWSCPFGVWIDDATNLCFTDTARAEVVWMDAGRRQMERWGRVGDQPLAIPVGVACASGLVYVADSGLGRVLMADRHGAARGAIDHAFGRPVALAAAGGLLYVADAVSNCVQVFDLGGAWVRTLGRGGAGPGELNRPTHVAVDGGGRVYVTDSLNCRIQVFAGDGRYLRAIGKPGDSSGHFGRPKGVAVDAQGRVFVVDGLYEMIQIFDEQGRLNMDFGGAGHEAGEFWLPAGVAVNAGGTLVVADSYNHRLQVFRLLPEPEEKGL